MVITRREEQQEATIFNTAELAARNTTILHSLLRRNLLIMSEEKQVQTAADASATQRPRSTQEMRPESTVGSGMNRRNANMQQMHGEMEKWRESMRHLVHCMKTEEGEEDAQYVLPRFHRPCELRQAWAKWLQGQPMETPEPFDGKAPLFMIPPMLREKVKGIRQKKSKMAEHDGLSDEESDIEILDAKELHGEEMEADQVAEEHEGHQREADDTHTGGDKAGDGQEKRKPSDPMQKWRDSMRNLRQTHPDLAARYPFQHPWQVRRAWATWLRDAPNTQQPFSSMPMWMTPPCLRAKIWAKMKSGDATDETSPTEKKRSMSAMEARMRHWRQHMCAVKKMQEIHGGKLPKGHVLASGNLPQFQHPWELRKAWEEWLNGRPLEEAEPFPGPAPLFMVPPCLRQQVKSIRRQKQECDVDETVTSSATSSEDENMVMVGEEEGRESSMSQDGDKRSTEETAEHQEAGATMAQKASNPTLTGRAVAGTTGEKTQGRTCIWSHPGSLTKDEAMQKWRHAMRGLHNTHPEMAARFPFTHPWQVRKAWTQFLAGKTEEEPYPGMPQWMIPPCLREELRRVRNGEEAKENSTPATDEEASTDDCSGSDREDLKTGTCPRGPPFLNHHHCAMSRRPRTHLKRTQGDKSEEKHGKEEHKQEKMHEDMEKWRLAMRNLSKSHPRLAERFPFTFPREVRAAWKSWLDPSAVDTPEPYPGMPLWMVPPCLREQVRRRRDTSQGLDHGMKKMKISEKTTKGGAEDVEEKQEHGKRSCGHASHRAAVEHWRQALVDAGVTSSPQQVRAEWVSWMQGAEERPMPYPLELAPPMVREKIMRRNERLPTHLGHSCRGRGHFNRGHGHFGRCPGHPKLHLVLTARPDGNVSHDPSHENAN